MADTTESTPRKRKVVTAKTTSPVTLNTDDAEWRARIEAEKAAKEQVKEEEPIKEAPVDTSVEQKESKPEEPKEDLNERNNFHDLLGILIQDEDTDIDAAVEAAENSGDKTFDSKNALRTESYGGKVAAALFQGLLTQMQEFNQHVLRINKDLDQLRNFSLEENKISTGRKFTSQCPDLKGAEARIAAIARLRGLTRVNLYNSGFWIVLRPFSLLELNEIINTIDSERKELGRTLGGHVFTIVDLFCRKKFMELLPMIVTNSNLSGYRNGSVLTDSISYHDYDVLVWAVCSMMYRDGIDLDLVCTNPECRHVDPKQHIDLSKLRYNNLAMMKPELLEKVTAGKPTTQEEVLAYQAELFSDINKVDSTDVILTLQAPTMGRFITIADAIMSKLVTALHGERSLANSQVTDSLGLTAIRMLSPWVACMEFKATETADAFKVTDPEAIMDVLENILDSGTDIYAVIDKFVAQTRISHIAYTSLECPACHKRPNGDLNNFFPFDVQYLFFYLAWRTLMLNGKQSSPISNSTPTTPTN